MLYKIENNRLKYKRKFTLKLDKTKNNNNNIINTEVII